MKYCWSVGINKLKNKRMLTLLILLLYLIRLYMKPILDFSSNVDYKVSPWSYPFLFANIYFLFLLSLGVIYLFSDVPFMDLSNMYQLVRTGRFRWAAGQIAGIILQSFFLMFYIYAVSVFWIVRQCEWTLDWGKLLHTAALTDAGSYYGFLFTVYYEPMQIYSPLCLTILTVLIGGLVISLIGIVMFTLSLYLNRIVGVTAGTVMVVMIYFVSNANPKYISILSKITPVGWMRTGMIGVYLQGVCILPTAAYIFAVLFITVPVISCLALWKIRNVEFEWVNEE